MRALGFPFDRGRLDESDHPFTEGVPGDVRITTRFDVKEPFTGLMGVLHEIGQAMYDLGLPEAWRDQPVGRDRGMALEESQSLLLEMILGRSRPFLAWLRPLLEKHYGCTGPEWEVENLYRTLIRVRRGAIRVDADELTYPVHIMLRYELEKQIFDGTLPVRRPAGGVARGLRAAARVAAGDGYRGLPAGRALGHRLLRLLPVVRARVLHRGPALRKPAHGAAEHFDSDIAAGRFGGLFEWLRQNVHGLGASVGAQELIRDATGKPLSAAPWLRYAEAKYLEEGTQSPHWRPRALVSAVVCAAILRPRSSACRRACAASSARRSTTFA